MFTRESLAKALLGTDLAKSFDYLLGKNALNRVLDLDTPTAMLVEPVNDTGADSGDDAETNATENEIYFCKSKTTCNSGSFRTKSLICKSS